MRVDVNVLTASIEQECTKYGCLYADKQGCPDLLFTQGNHINTKRSEAKRKNTCTSVVAMVAMLAMVGTHASANTCSSACAQTSVAAHAGAAHAAGAVAGVRAHASSSGVVASVVACHLVLGSACTKQEKFRVKWFRSGMLETLGPDTKLF